MEKVIKDAFGQLTLAQAKGIIVDLLQELSSDDALDAIQDYADDSGVNVKGLLD